MKQKKIVLLILVAVISLFALQTNVYADVYCSIVPDAVIDDSIADAVHTIIRIIQIAVPIILVVLGMIDFLKALMAQKEDEIKKGQQIFIKRAIAAIIVFFVIAIVKFVISAVAGTDSSDIINCANCFIEGSNSPSCQSTSSGDADADTM